MLQEYADFGQPQLCSKNPEHSSKKPSTAKQNTAQHTTSQTNSAALTPAQLTMCHNTAATAAFC